MLHHFGSLTPLGKKLLKFYAIAIGVFAVSFMLYQVTQIKSSGSYHAYTNGINNSRLVKDKIGRVLKIPFLANELAVADSVYYVSGVTGSKQKMVVLGKVVFTNGQWQLVSLEEDNGRFEALRHRALHP